MTIHSLTLHATMFVSSFIAGIALYYLLAIEQTQQFLQLIEPVIKNIQDGNTLAIVLRTFATFVVITIFASNPILSFISYIIIAAKVAIFSLCSMYLVIEHQNILAYSIWWFPIQLINCIVLIMYYVRLTKLKGKSKKVVATVILFMLIELSILLAELVIIRYV